MAYPPTPTYWLDPTNDVLVGLRRYKADTSSFTCDGGYHQALVFTGIEPAAWRDTGHGRVLDDRPDVAHDDPRWPAACSCGYEFVDGDPWQVWQDLVYRRGDTGQLMVLREHDNIGLPVVSAGPGAMWDRWWMPEPWRGPDGICLMVKLPSGHEWMVDAEAANCTRKGQPHQCWVRHGDPRTDPVTVDKQGETCNAGAGSVIGGDWHGFLRGGVLVAC